jgi:hypothetical protein
MDAYPQLLGIILSSVPWEEQSMRRTPRLPKCVRDFSPSECPDEHPWCLATKNVYELPGLERERKLFGTERMVYSNGREVQEWTFGDWDCDMLLLLQDAAPVDRIASRNAWHPDPFGARNFIEEPRAATNKNLYDLAHGIHCRKLVGSALIGLLKPGSDYSGPIRDCSYVTNYCLRALAWVLEPKQTPNLRTLLCLGVKAGQFASEMQRRRLADFSRFRVTHLPHPSRYPPGGISVATAAWRRMASESGFVVH